MRFVSSITLILLLPMAAGGCHWSKWISRKEDTPPSALPAPKLAQETIVLEVAFVRYLPEDKFPTEEVWNSIDEQIVPLDRRKELWAQGLRMGVVGWQLPKPLQQKLDEQAAANQQLLTGQVDLQKRMQLRPDKPGSAICYPHRDSVVVLKKSDSGGVTGKTYYAAQCQMEVRAYPANDSTEGEGSVQLTLTPEIIHGDQRQRWVGDDGSFRFDSGQGRDLLSDAKLQASLSPGQTLVVTCTQPSIGLGQCFFTNDVDEGHETKILLIRLAQVSSAHAFETEDADIFD